MWQLTCGLLISVIGITAITVLPIKAAGKHKLCSIEAIQQCFDTAIATNDYYV